MNGWMYCYEWDRWKIWYHHEKNVTSSSCYDINVIFSFWFSFCLRKKKREKMNKINEINSFLSFNDNIDKIRKEIKINVWWQTWLIFCFLFVILMFEYLLYHKHSLYFQKKMKYSIESTWNDTFWMIFHFSYHCEWISKHNWIEIKEEWKNETNFYWWFQFLLWKIS